MLKRTVFKSSFLAEMVYNPTVVFKTRMSFAVEGEVLA